MIMSGCAAFAQVVGSTRIEAELLPQWWEQVRAIYHHIEYQGLHWRDKQFELNFFLRKSFL